MSQQTFERRPRGWHKTGTADRAAAKTKCPEIAAEVERQLTALREGPKALTGKQISALPGIAYRAFAQGLEDNPGLPAKGGSELRRQLTRQKEATLSSSPRMMQSDVSPEKAQGANFGLTVSHQISGLRQALRSFPAPH